MRIAVARNVLAGFWVAASIGIGVLVFSQQGGPDGFGSDEAGEVYATAGGLIAPYLTMIIAWAVEAKPQSKVKKLAKPALFWIGMAFSLAHFAIAYIALLRNPEEPTLSALQSAMGGTALFSVFLVPVLTAHFVKEK